MKLERIKCKPLERAKNLCISQSYIIGCTGPKAVILDKQRNLIHTIEGLEYVYSAEVSPDETKLLLISNGNKFYIVDMQSLEKIRVAVKEADSICSTQTQENSLRPYRKNTVYRALRNLRRA